MTESQDAVALAQLERARAVVERRNGLGSRLSSLLRGVPGIVPQVIFAGCKHSYFPYLFDWISASWNVPRMSSPKRLARKESPTRRT